MSGALNIIGTELSVLDDYGRQLVDDAIAVAHRQLIDLGLEVQTAGEWRAALAVAGRLVLLELAQQIADGAWSRYGIRTREDMGLETGARPWLRSERVRDALEGLSDDAIVVAPKLDISVIVHLPAFIAPLVLDIDTN